MAPRAVGPKIRSPDASKRSTIPLTSGASGPTTVRSICSLRAKSRSPARSSALQGMHSASPAIPPLPGAQYIVVTHRLCFSFQTRACSRPPPPTTSTFIQYPPYLAQYHLTRINLWQLVFEVAFARKNHCHARSLCSVNHCLIADRPARLDQRSHASRCCAVDGVGKRQKAV